jgi:opacity protein-like surface antigen
LCLGVAASGQRFHVGVFGGLAAYNGDLTDKIYPKKVTNGAIGITANYELTDNIMLRAGYTYAIVGGADRFSKDQELINRNLSFETKLNEFSLVGEYYLQNLYDHRWSPYAFAGLAVYKYNPYAYDPANNKVYLKPLSTEGQGLAGYNDRKPYHLTQVALPFGAGVKFAVNNDIHIGLEVGFRKLFTDYLDDVSTTYADPADLLAAKGQQAVDMSYRGDEVATGSPTYPAKGFQRGGSEYKDFYYFTGLHLTYRLGGGGGNGGGGGGRKSRLGCPTNVY